MIAWLRGRLLEKDAETIVVDVGGVGYLLSVSATAARNVGLPGGDVRLFVHTHAVQDGGLTLYGFTDREERELFQTLIGVQGVGPKVALAILAGLPLGELAKAIASADIARLTQIRGVGRKTAERLAVELRDRLAPFPVGPAAETAGQGGASPAGSPAAPPLPQPLVEVQGALAALGYRSAEVEPVLARLDPERPVADLVRQALAALRRI